MQAIYQIDGSAPTGTCGVAILGGERSLVANLGAANNYKVSRSQSDESMGSVACARWHAAGARRGRFSDKGHIGGRSMVCVCGRRMPLDGCACMRCPFKIYAVNEFAL